MATCNPQELLASAACIDCLSPGLKETLKLQLLCEIANGAGDAGITELTGDVTAGPGTGSVAATIAAGAVTLAKMANLSANSVIGNSTGLSATPQALAAGSVGLAVLAATTQAAARAAIGAGTGSGTVTDVSVTTANGVSGSVATSTTTPAITLTLGAITPISAAFSGTGGNGFIKLLTQSSNPTAPASGFALFADASGRFSWRRASDSFVRTFELTATADRVFTIPDASFTLAGQNLANTFTLANTFSANGALSAPSVSFTGTPFTGGSASTTQGLVKIGSGTSGGLSTSGTMLEVQAPPAFAGDVQNWGVNGSNLATLSSGGVFSCAGVTLGASSSLRWSSDLIQTRKSAANLQLGAADAAAPVAQKLSRQSVVAGTSNTAGVLFTDVASLGTGTGDPGSTGRQTGIRNATGTVQHTPGWRDFIAGKDTTLTEATATTLFTITVGTGKYLGMIVECTVFASDGTDFQALHSTLRINTGNKAGALGTTGIMQTDCATPYNSSGTLTPVTYTLVDNGSGVLAVKCAATSSLTQTTLTCKYQITAINSSDAITITPA